MYQTTCNKKIQKEKEILYYGTKIEVLQKIAEGEIESSITREELWWQLSGKDGEQSAEDY